MLCNILAYIYPLVVRLGASLWFECCGLCAVLTFSASTDRQVEPARQGGLQRNGILPLLLWAMNSCLWDADVSSVEGQTPGSGKRGSGQGVWFYLRDCQQPRLGLVKTGWEYNPLSLLSLVISPCACVRAAIPFMCSMSPFLCIIAWNISVDHCTVLFKETVALKLDFLICVCVCRREA